MAKKICGFLLVTTTVVVLICEKLADAKGDSDSPGLVLFVSIRFGSVPLPNGNDGMVYVGSVPGGQ